MASPYASGALAGGLGGGAAALGAGANNAAALSSYFAPTALETMGSGASYAGANALGAAGGATKAGLLAGINPWQVGAGLGISALGSMGGETPQFEMSPMYGDATERLLGGKGISELGSVARDKLLSNMGEEFTSTPDAYYEAATRRLNESYDKAEKDFAAQYKSLRPGANVENDSAYREGINKIRQDRARETSGIAADLDFRRETEYLNRQAQSIQQALGVDRQTMQDYMALAQLETAVLAMNTGVSINEAEDFKKIFGDLGGMFMQRGLGLDANASLARLAGQFGGAK